MNWSEEDPLLAEEAEALRKKLICGICDTRYLYVSRF